MGRVLRLVVVTFIAFLLCDDVTAGAVRHIVAQDEYVAQLSKQIHLLNNPVLLRMDLEEDDDDDDMEKGGDEGDSASYRFSSSSVGGNKKDGEERANKETQSSQDSSISSSSSFSSGGSPILSASVMDEISDNGGKTTDTDGDGVTNHEENQANDGDSEWLDTKVKVASGLGAVIGGGLGLGISRMALGENSEFAKKHRSHLNKMRKNVARMGASGYEDCKSRQECLSKTLAYLKTKPENDRHGFMVLLEADRVLHELERAPPNEQLVVLEPLQDISELFRYGKYGSAESIAADVRRVIGTLFKDQDLVFKLYTLPNSPKADGRAIKFSFYGQFTAAKISSQSIEPEDGPFLRSTGTKNGKTFEQTVIDEITEACQVTFGLLPGGKKAEDEQQGSLEQPLQEISDDEEQQHSLDHRQEGQIEVASSISQKGVRKTQSFSSGMGRGGGE